MIKVIVDKASEYVWMETIIQQGSNNMEQVQMDFFKQNNIDANQTINYKASEDYIIDIDIEESEDKEK